MVRLPFPQAIRTSVCIGVLLAATASAHAQEPPPDSDHAPAHIAFVDGAAILERDGVNDDAPGGMPLMAGDRVRTQSGRVEILFGDGATLHVDRYSVVDLQSDDLLRLIEGRVRLTIPSNARTVAYRLDGPHGWARILDAGDYRVSILRSASTEELELAVLRGRAELANDGGQTPLRAGERAFARAGASPSYAYVANSSAMDAFDRWSENRRDARLAASAEYLPDEVRSYSPALAEHGYWRDEPDYGRVWYPRVAPDWRPYYRGRWVHLRPYGWTWVAHDPWGWPTHHYGRWGISTAGWFWIPGRTWGAAWVSWASAPGYVSWCPLGWDNRPVFQIGFSVGRRGYDPWRAWTVLPQRHFGYGVVHRNVVNITYIDHRTRGAFVSRDRGPDVRGQAVPRAAAPIRVAGTSPGRRGVAPLYTNLPADRGRMRTDGARIRVPDAAPARGRAVPRAETRDRAYPVRPAVRSERPADREVQPAPGARAGWPEGDLRSARPTDDIRSARPGDGIPSARPADGLRSARPADAGAHRPNADGGRRIAVPRHDTPAATLPHRVEEYRGGARAPRPTGDPGGRPSAAPPVDGPARGPGARPSDGGRRPSAAPRGGDGGPPAGARKAVPRGGGIRDN